MRDSLIKRHYENLRQGKLLAHRCGACNAVTFPITTACERCGSTQWTELQLSGRGTLHFASHNLAPAPHPRFAGIAPYVYGHIVLEEGITTQAILQGVAPEPAALQALYERGPQPVRLEVMETADLPVMAFRLEASS